MEQRQNKTVYGYVRENYDGICPEDIVKLIYEFYLFSLDSKIMNDNEQMLLLHLLYDTLTKKDKYKNTKSIDFKFLYRASENKYLASKFHEACDDKGATITVIHNDRDYICGGFTSKSWSKSCSTDPDAFLFVIRPKVKSFGLTKGYLNGMNAIGYYKSYGPVFGNGTDLWIHDHCNSISGDNGTNPLTFDFTKNELLGLVENSHFVIKDYEVFSIITK